MTTYVLDSNAITAVLQENNKVAQRFEAATDHPDHEFLGCPVVYYEVKRGLLAQDGKKQIQQFEAIFQGFEWDDYHQAEWRKAAELWMQRRSMGRPIQDNDLLIAVFALNRDAVLVTNNTKDFEHLGVQLEDWTA